jgi:hypothetical protein
MAVRTYQIWVDGKGRPLLQSHPLWLEVFSLMVNPIAPDKPRRYAGACFV